MKTLFSLLSLVAFTSSAVAQGDLTRREATVAALDPKHKFVTFLVDPKARTTAAKPYRCELRVSDEIVFQQLPSRRKVQAATSDIRVGQRVILSGYTSVSSLFATEVIILPTNPR